jgi:hypothetical protein
MSDTGRHGIKGREINNVLLTLQHSGDTEARSHERESGNLSLGQP